jgi:multicomponent Na+:H+ antiporter subunit F
VNVFFVAAAAAVFCISAVTAYRVVRSGSIFDRLLATGAVGTNGIVMMAIIGFIFARPDMFVDLAITYSLLNFIGAVAAAKYLERQPGGEQ